MWKRLNTSAVDQVKRSTNEPEVKLKGILRNCTKNPTPNIVSYRRSLKHQATQYFDMEEWDEVFTAKDLTKIAVAKANCIPIIPKKYRKQFGNGSHTQNIKKNSGSNEGDNSQIIKSLDEQWKHFGAAKSDSDLLKDTIKEKLRKTTSTEGQGITKRSSTISQTEISENNPKSIPWRPNLIRRTVRLEEKPIIGRRSKRLPTEELKFLYNSPFSTLQNTAKLGQKLNMGNNGKRLKIQSLVDTLTKDPVQF